MTSLERLLASAQIADLLVTYCIAFDDQEIELADDGLSARALTDVVWIAANFQNAIVGRYVDEIVSEDGRWRFRRRREIPVQYRAGPPPMSESARAVSGATMHQELLIDG